MSANIPTAAESFYGPGGPITGGPAGDQARQALIDGGKAQPASLLSGPAEASSASTPPPPADARRSAPTAESFNAASFNLAEGLDRDSPQFAEFAGLAKDLGLDNAKAEKLVALHASALKAQAKGFADAVAGWEQETRQVLGTQAPEMASAIRSKIGNDADAQRFLQLMNWSGMGNNVSVLRVLHRLARGY
jgi:hypothetical protein